MDPITMMIVGGLAGGLIGGASTYFQHEDQQNQIRKKQGLAEQAYGYQGVYQDQSFSLQKERALEDLDIQQNRLAQALGADVAGFNLGLAGQAQTNQAARISLASNAGATQAWQGASGTRSNDALQRNINYEETALSRQMNLQQRSNSLALTNMTRQYSNQFNDIGREIDSWNPGGYRYQAKELSDIYAKQMHNLNMEEYNQAIADAAATPLDYLAGILGGAREGTSFAMQIAGLSQQKGR
jgi:hypothetical protein